jgi:hypothetical protein
MKRTLLGLALALTLQANGLDELKAALSRLQGQGTLKGTYEVSAWSRGGKGKEIEEATGKAMAWAEEDASGLTLRWDRALLRRAEEEGKASKAAKRTDSAALGLESLSAPKVSAALNFAPKLAQLLATAQVKGEGAEGAAAHWIDLQLTPPEADKETKAKENTYTVRIRVGADGLPFAASFTRAIKASVMFISMEMNTTEELTFSVLANRLVVLRKEERMATKTLGMELQQRTIATFAPK